MNDSFAPLQAGDNLSQLDLSRVEEDAKKSMWEISQTDNSISRASSFRAADDAGHFQQNWGTVGKEFARQTTKKSLFSKRKSRASIGPSSANPERDNQQTVSPERKREAFGNRKTARRIVSAMFVVNHEGRSSKLVMGCNSVEGSAQSSSASQSLESERHDMKSLMFDEDLVSVAGQRKKKQVHIVESQSFGSNSSEEAMAKQRQQELMAEESSWEILRQRWSISQASHFYHIWKVVEILLSFATALYYCYEATFVHLQTEEQKGSFKALDILFQLFFLTSLAIYILLDEHHPADGPWEPVASFAKLIRQEQFIINVITLIPFPQLTSSWFSPLFCQRLHLIKALRLKYGLGFLDYKILKKSLHQLQISRLQLKLKDPEFENNPQEDSAKMTAIMLTTEVLKTLRLVVIIVFLSFFTGSLWFIFSEYIAGLELVNSSDEDNFITAFDLGGDLSSGPSTKLTYFAFTTLSTVGLGDMHPRNSAERVLCSIVMLFGVMCTSMLMDNFSMMIKRLQNFGKPYDESKQFSLFMGTLKSFNEGQLLDSTFENRMEQYFHYRWSLNRNLAISTDSDMGLYDELPGRLKTELYVDFLFKGFIDKYRLMLDLGQSHFPYKRKYLREVKERQTDISQIDWTRYYTDYTHDDFLVSLLRELEPIKFHYGKLLLREGQDPVTEVYFPMRGELQFGYNHQKFLEQVNIDEMNIPFDPEGRIYQEVRGRITQNFKQQAMESKMNHKRFDFPVVLGPGSTVGLFEIIFNKPSQFSVRVVHNDEDPIGDRQRIADCYFIRQSNWRKILEVEDGDEKQARLVERFKTNALTSFIRRVYQPIREHKQCFVQRENMMIFKDYDKHRLRNEELYKEIAKPLIDPPKMKKLRKLSSKQSSLQLINEKRKRTLMMSQGMNLIAGGIKRQQSEVKKSNFKSLDDVANMIAASTLDLHHQPFKHISLLSLHRESKIKEEPIISDLQKGIQKKVHEANQLLRVLQANMRLMKMFLERTKAALDSQEDQLTHPEDTSQIKALKAEVANLKAKLKTEQEQNKSPQGTLHLRTSDDATPPQAINKRGSFFSFKDHRKSIQNEPLIPTWSLSQKKESLSSRSSKSSSSSMTSSPAQVKVHSLHDPKSTTSLTKLEQTMSLFSLMKTPTLQSEVQSNQSLFKQTPFTFRRGSKGPVLDIEINLLSALKQAGIPFNLKEESSLKNLQTITMIDSPLPNGGRGQLLSDKSLPGAGGSSGSIPSEVPEVFFRRRETSEKQQSLQALPTGNFNSILFDDQSVSCDADSPLPKAVIQKKKKQEYGRRLHRPKKLKIRSIPSLIVEERNDEEASPKSQRPQSPSSPPSKAVPDVASCSSSVTCTGVESRIGESPFLKMLGDDSSESLSCVNISDIKAQIQTEGETPENQIADQDTAPNALCKAQISQRQPEEREVSDEPNRASPIGTFVLYKTKIME